MSSKDKLEWNRFAITPEEIGDMLVQDHIRNGKSLAILKKHNGLLGITQTLKSDLMRGISCEPESLKMREEHFGNNQPYVRERKGFWFFVWESLKDTVLQILIVAAVVSLVIGFAQKPSSGWLEGVAILSAVVIVVIVTAVNDSMKEKQFIKLNQQVDTHKVVVTRDGSEKEISAKELLVGDIMCIGPGEILPADGLLVKGSNIVVDESALTGESDTVKKSELRGSDYNSDIFLISGSKVIEGNGLVLVCAVGPHSVQGKNKRLTDHLEEDQETPLQESLTGIAAGLGKLGFYAGLVLTIVLIGHISFDSVVDGKWDKEATEGLVSAVILGITILVVAIPEGLPLALTLAMAYSVFRMKEENIFVRHIKGCETMGAATYVCSDKTGTLTENRMKVTRSKFYRTQGTHLTEHQKKVVCQSISRNTTAFITLKEGVQELIGNRTECAMLQLVETYGEKYQLLREINSIKVQFAFNSSSKRMTTVYGYQGKTVVYTKGAPEVVLKYCKYLAMPDDSVAVLDEKLTDEIKEEIASFSKDGLRVLALACKTTEEVYEPDISQEEFEKDLVFLGLLGIEDPLRSEAKNAVDKVQHAGVKVVMVTGDSLETAIKIAKESGILEPSFTNEESQAMEGYEFRQRAGGLVTQFDENEKVSGFKVGDIEAFKEMASGLKVIARCSPEDKLLLVMGLRQLGEVVGVTGDGSNDAAALKQSDIGLAMMSGTALAKESADIILIDDNFMSVVNSVKWGRNVYSSIRKFLQFQITVNVVALVVSIVGALTVEDSPLTAVQMLWVNLIMDSLAALALATEQPTEDLFESKPFGRNESIINSDMYATIVSQTVYQVAVLLVLLYLGPSIFDIEESFGKDDWTEDNGRHFTMFFHTFVMLQVFNEINCRKLSLKEWNFFKNFFQNMMFAVILVATVAIQLMLVELGGEPLKCSPLSLEQHAACILVGAAGLLVALIVRICATSFKFKSQQKSKEETPLLINS